MSWTKLIHMLHTRHTRVLNPAAVTAESAAQAVTVVGRFLVRYGLVVVLAWIGALKYFPYEAAAIQSLIAHSPPLSWLYGIFNVGTLGDALGSAEIVAALLIALRPLWPRVSAVGSVFAVLIFCSTNQLPVHHTRSHHRRIRAAVGAARPVPDQGHCAAWCLAVDTSPH
jgi:hypothetical protein